MIGWHVWSINQQKYKRALDFVKTIDEIVDVFYPLVETKKKKGKSEIPLYANYLFLKYEHNNTIMNILLNSPYFYTYVGECDESEIERVAKLSEKTYEEILVDDKLVVGNYYKLKSTPFKGMFCRVVSINDNKVVVAVELFGSDRLVKCSVDDILTEGT